MRDEVMQQHPLLSEGDPAPVTVLNAAAERPVLLICDHAGNAVPRRLAGLGLEAGALEQHVAWDIGAADLTGALSARLDVPAVLSTYSRLVIDLNRQPGDPESIPARSDGIEVPGNRGLSDGQAAQREEALFWPYHHAIARQIAHLWRMGAAPALISVHSFTPCMSNGRPRPWHVGVLWNRDPRLAVPLMARLREHPDLVVGDNEPYSGREVNYSIDTHAGAAGLPNVAIEVRQDLISDAAGVRRWTGLLADALEPILAQPGLHEARSF